MSEDTDKPDEDLETDIADDAVEDGEGGGKKKMAGKKLVLFVILPALLVIIGGVTTAMMLLGGGKAEAAVEESAEAPETEEKSDKKKDDGKGKDGDGAKEGSVKEASEAESNGATIQIGEPGNPSFYTMPKILVTVSNGSGRRSQLLLKLTLETDDPEIFDRVDAMLPRITDQFQMFLREMRVDDLSGSAGDYRIRRELLRRVNMSLYPESVDAVLIEEFIVQ